MYLHTGVIGYGLRITRIPAWKLVMRFTEMIMKNQEVIYTDDMPSLESKLLTLFKNEKFFRFDKSNYREVTETNISTLHACWGNIIKQPKVDLTESDES